MQKNFLTNVAIIRPILILLLVFYHAFAIYSGAWTPIEGYPEIKAYWWLDKLSYAFMLEMFVFVSGYVFGFQIRTKGEAKLQAKTLLWGKFKRLMIPCMVFSLLYILFFGNITQPIFKTLYGMVNGVGHMWFLPMLFWCFMGVWVIERLQLKANVVIPILIVISLISYLPLPLRMGNAMYYLLFFYIGYILQKGNASLDRFFTWKYALGALVLFSVLFPSLTLLKENIGNIMAGGGLMKAIHLSAAKLAQVIYAFAGLTMLFLWVGYAERKRTKSISQKIIKFGNLCFGVYLWQQFILIGLYNYTNFPTIFGGYWLPWVGFVVALLGSVLVSHFLVKTKAGKILIG